MGNRDNIVVWKKKSTTKSDAYTVPIRRAYRNPTEDRAIAHVMREEKMKRKKQQTAKRPRNRGRGEAEI